MPRSPKTKRLEIFMSPAQKAKLDALNTNLAEFTRKLYAQYFASVGESFPDDFLGKGQYLRQTTGYKQILARFIGGEIILSPYLGESPIVATLGFKEPHMAEVHLFGAGWDRHSEANISHDIALMLMEDTGA